MFYTVYFYVNVCIGRITYTCLVLYSINYSAVSVFWSINFWKKAMIGFWRYFHLYKFSSKPPLCYFGWASVGNPCLHVRKKGSKEWVFLFLGSQLHWVALCRKNFLHHCNLPLLLFFTAAFWQNICGCVLIMYECLRHETFFSKVMWSLSSAWCRMT